MTNEATRLAEEAKRLAFLVPNFSDYVLLRDAINALAALAQPAVSEESTLIPDGLGREEIRGLICAKAAAKGDEARDAARYRWLRSVGGRVWSIWAKDGRPISAAGLAFVYDDCVDREIDAAMASQEKPHD